MAFGGCMPEVFDSVVEVLKVAVGWCARLGSGEGHGGEYFGAAFGCVHENAEESEVSVWVAW